jgi:ABC-type bacteriocin/lantibiotic exporter with double-glycine peptidase domain
MKKLFFLRKHLYKYKYLLGFSLLLYLTLMLIELGTTYLTGNYIDLLISNKSIKTIYTFTAILLIIGLSGIIFGNLNTFISSKLQANMVFDINFELIQHVKKLPIKFFRNIDSVYLNQRINGDSNTVVNFIISIIVQATTKIVTFIVVLYILKEKNSLLSIMILVSIPIYILIYILFEKKLYNSALNFKEEQNLLFSKMNKQLTNVSFIKLNSLFLNLDKELLNSYPPFLRSLYKYIKSNYYFTSIASIISNIFNVILFLYGGIAIYNNKMTVGDFIIIQSYYFILLESISYLTTILKSYPEVKVSYNRLLEILNTKVEQNGVNILDNISSINVKNISFQFDDKPIIKGFNYVFESGNVYIIKGENGIGKSTLTKLILGLYIGEFDGEILYNNYSIKDIDLYDCRKRLISIIDQEPLLVNSDFNKNLTQNIENVDKELMENLIETFNLNHLASDKNNESNSQRDFSGGEKQKISIIRALLKNPNVIIMDEPTSALDINSTNILIDIISKLKNTNKIIIIISHDKRLDSICDYTLQMSEISTDLEVST